MAATGVCIWFTGRSGSGKSTVTDALVPLLESAGRTVSVLDVVPVLAKSRWERSSRGKLLRKAFVAGEIARHGGIAIAVTVSAQEEVRAEARAIVGAERFVEVHTDVPLEVSDARRATRGRRPPLHKRLRRAVRRVRGSRRAMPSYEAPATADLTLDTVSLTPDECARRIVALLVERGFLAVVPQP